jgi:hypothetical protein
MNIPFISRLLILCACPGAMIISCNPERSRQGPPLEERSPGGALGTRGTGANEPAPPEVREKQDESSF